MAEQEKIDREALSQALRIPIPENARVEISVQAEGSDFRGEIRFEDGEMSSRKRLTQPIELKSGVIGNMWPG
jgi:hypothetical protein